MGFFNFPIWVWGSGYNTCNQSKTGHRKNYDTILPKASAQ